MSRMAQRAILAAGVACTLLACGPARADAARAPGLGCASPVYDRPVCRGWRTAQRRARAYRPVIADLRSGAIDPALYGAGRYLSLLVLGVGY